jgi:hypothetical protein
MALRDYKVPFRSLERIAKEALFCRRFAKNEYLATFNIVAFVEQILPLILVVLKKGPLHFDFMDVPEGKTPAYVTYNPVLTLHIDRETWELARLGEPKARFIVAHEVGHIVLHDHYAQSFSDDPSEHITFVQEEERAEWQANNFASYLLLTACVLDAFHDADDLARSCIVPQAMAAQRLALADEERQRKERCARARTYLGDPCPRCGNFTVLALGLELRCDICGHRCKAIPTSHANADVA